MFKEITAQLPIGRKGDLIEIQVDLDVGSGKAIAVYTDRRHYENMPVLLKRLDWNARQNSLFIHANDPGKAWKYLKEKAFYDLDEE
jgi:hypothetical protein